MSLDTTLVASEPLVRSKCAAGVATITLNRGQRFNPLSAEMIAALQKALDDVAANSEARVVVLGAEGRGFCAGHDLKEIRARAGDHAWQRRLFDDCSRMMKRITELPQPVIARVTASPRPRAVNWCRCATWPWRPTRPLRVAGCEHRRLLLDTRGRRREKYRPQARDGTAADRSPSTRGRRSTGAS